MLREMKQQILYLRTVLYKHLCYIIMFPVACWMHCCSVVHIFGMNVNAFFY